VAGGKQLQGPFPEFTVTDFTTAARIFKHPAASREVKWVVSIGARMAPPAGFDDISPKRKLRLAFDDIDNSYYTGYKRPTIRDINEIVGFARKAKEGNVLVHCAAGQSRSSATALLMIMTRMGVGHEEDAVTHLHHCVAEASGKLLRPPIAGIHPNRLLIWLGDHYFGCEGRLWDATVRSMGPEYTKGFKPPVW